MQSKFRSNHKSLQQNASQRDSRKRRRLQMGHIRQKSLQRPNFPDEMKLRTTQLWTKGELKLQLASKEDIFLFKGITEREADLDDMRILAESGLDWNIIHQECQNQSTSSGRLWDDALYQKLLDLKEKYHIESPIEKPLRKRARRETNQNHLNRGDQERKQHCWHHIASNQTDERFCTIITQQFGSKKAN